MGKENEEKFGENDLLRSCCAADVLRSCPSVDGRSFRTGNFRFRSSWQSALWFARLGATSPLPPERQLCQMPAAGQPVLRSLCRSSGRPPTLLERRGRSPGRSARDILPAGDESCCPVLGCDEPQARGSRSLGQHAGRRCPGEIPANLLQQLLVLEESAIAAAVRDAVPAAGLAA